jgi:hypothetical protein
MIMTLPSAGEMTTLSLSGVILSGSRKKFIEKIKKIIGIMIRIALIKLFCTKKLITMRIKVIIAIMPSVVYPYFVIIN